MGIIPRRESEEKWYSIYRILTKKNTWKAEKKRKTKARVNRTATLSDKVKSDAFKQFESFEANQAPGEEVSIDQHVKMNDNFMRTGPYKAKKK